MSDDSSEISRRQKTKPHFVNGLRKLRFSSIMFKQVLISSRPWHDRRQFWMIVVTVEVATKSPASNANDALPGRLPEQCASMHPKSTTLGVHGPYRVPRILGLFRAEALLTHVTCLQVPTSLTSSSIWSILGTIRRRSRPRNGLGAEKYPSPPG